MITISANVLWSRVIPAKDIHLIKKVFEYQVTRWYQGQYSKKRVQGVDHMLGSKGLKTGRFLTGLLPLVKEYCDINKIPINITYNCAIPAPFAFKPCLEGITFREDQLRLLETVGTDKRGTIVSPTGSGKTVLAGGIISMFPESTCVFVVHTESLFVQTVEEFGKWFPDEVGEIKAETFVPRRINVITSQTAQSIISSGSSDKRYESFRELLEKTKVLIVDEAHHITNKQGAYATIFQNCFAEIRIGVTATELVDKKKCLVCTGYTGPVIGEFTVREGIEKGILAKPIVKLIPVPYTVEIGAYKTYKEQYRYGIIENRSRNRLIAKEAQEQIKNGNTVLIVIKDTEHKHGLRIKDLMKEIYDVDAAYIEGSTPSKEREDVKRKIGNKEIMCVICTLIWKEGINIPSLGCIINAIGGKSDITTKQIAGRGFRISDNKNKFTLVDFLDPYRHLAIHTVLRVSTYVEEGWM